MEEFVEELLKGRKTEIIEKKNTKLRDILKSILNSSCDIEILENGEKDGDVKFAIKREDMNVTLDTVIRYQSEMFSDFMANFLGEFFIRENINKFTRILLDMGDKYFCVVNQYDHKRFGMELLNDKFIFAFHISLLRNIFTEDFRKNLKKKIKKKTL